MHSYAYLVRSLTSSPITDCVSIHTDNKNIDTIIGIGSRKHTLQDINIEIHNTCEENNVHLSSKWIPRETNQN
jgi:hypothetical protein